MKRWILWLVGIAAGSFVLSCIGFPLTELPLVFMFGWILFLIKTLPQTTVEPAALLVGAAALAVLIGVVHFLARWLYGAQPVAAAAAGPADAAQQSAGQAAPPIRIWRLRWTFAAVFLVVFLFAAGIALIVTVHQTGWLLTSPHPWYHQGMEAARRMQSNNNLKNIGLAFANYHDTYHQLPSGGTMNEYGELLHSWETQLLPYLEDNRKPNFDLPWNHPENAAFFQREKDVFLNPGIDQPGPDRVGYTVDQEGFGLSHYAANSHVLGINSAVRHEDVTDGTSNTILTGEVKANFKPWGDPVNWRDPAEGLQKSPDGFGGPWTYGMTMFSMLDGSVQTIAADVDPEILKALATPAGGEKVPDR